MESFFHLAALCAVPEMGPVTIRRLLSVYGSPENVFKAGGGELRRIEGVGKKRADNIGGLRESDSFRKDLERVMKEGARVLTYESPEYPKGLMSLGDDAPLVVYVKGEIIEEDRYAVAIVGSRKSTPYGISVAERIASDLTDMGLTVVSGGARGIDTAAHIGSVRSGGRSIAVMGSGIDISYPAENRGLFERISRSGAVLSEFAPGMRPNRENFPRRNRLISGLSMGVLVVEAASKSGALITASHALEQGKEVFSVPGNISSSASSGTNDLIKQGAKMVLKAEDILEELAPQMEGLNISRKSKKMPHLTKDEKELYDIMTQEPRHIDDISRESGVPVSKALGMLLGLELRGVIRQTEGKKFFIF
jgi:DNA processing protein